MPYCAAKLKEGNKAALKRHYGNHKEQYLERNRNRRKIFTEYSRQVKKHSVCASCGISDWRVLQFHHRDRKLKKFNVGMPQDVPSMKALKKEIKKCTVLCANCHLLAEWKYNHKKKRAKCES